MFQAFNPGAISAVVLGMTGCTTMTTETDSTPGARFGPPPKPNFAMSQLDYPEKLGNGRYTIESSGCFLTSLAMTSCILHERRDIDPPTANRMVKANGGFSGSGLDLPDAAPALGLSVEHREEIGTSNRARLRAKLDASLEAKRPVVMGVDFKPGASSGHSDADHFIMVYERTASGHYKVLDPAGGRVLTLEADSQGNLHYRGNPNYQISEMLFLKKASFKSDPSNFDA